MCGIQQSCHVFAIDACGCVPSIRHFRTKQEKKEMLERYRDQLKKEIEGIEESIKNLENK